MYAFLLWMTSSCIIKVRKREIFSILVFHPLRKVRKRSLVFHPLRKVRKRLMRRMWLLGTKVARCAYVSTWPYKESHIVNELWSFGMSYHSVISTMRISIMKKIITFVLNHTLYPLGKIHNIWRSKIGGIFSLSISHMEETFLM